MARQRIAFSMAWDLIHLRTMKEVLNRNYGKILIARIAPSACYGAWSSKAI